MHELRGGGIRLRGVRGRDPRHRLRRRVPARRREVGDRRRRVRAPGARGVYPDIPVILHSSQPENEAAGEESRRQLPAQGLAAVLLREPRQVMLEDFGFGDFVFRLSGRQRGRPGAATCKTLEERLRDGPGRVARVPRDAQPLLALAEGAHRVRRRRRPAAAPVAGFRHDGGDARASDVRDRRLPPRAGRSCSSPTSTATRSTSRATSTASAAARSAARRAASPSSAGCWSNVGLRDRFPASASACRAAVVLGTDVFDQFLEENDLRRFAIECDDDEEMLRRFLAATLPGGDRAATSRPSWRRRAIPLAVRSSSLLEDSPAPAVRRRLRHATCSPTTSADLEVRLQRAADGDQAGLRLDLRARAPRSTSRPPRTASRRRRWR